VHGASWAKTLITLAALLGSAGTVGAGSISLAWENREIGSHTYKLERSVGAGAPFATVATLPQAQVTWIDTQVTPAVIYCYRVQACNDTGCSGYANYACGVLPTGAK
jgi:hypothetical protein